jgi:hypothetical protein
VTASFTPLPWDSEFFGFSIAKVELTDRSSDEITAIEDAARADGIVCLYGSLDPADPTASLAVQSLGWRFVEAAVMSSLHPRELQMPHPPGISVRTGTADDLPELAPLIALLAPWSRFAADPRFGQDAALRMQTAWIERAAKCTTGEFELVVAVNDEDDSIVAFISRAREPKPVVDTVGTLTVGAGAARLLIQISRAWAGEGSLLGGPIAARNTTASRFVQTVGYRATWTRYLFHRWLDEPHD